MKRLVELKVNGEVYEVAAAPNQTLLEVLRDELHLTGTKEACNEGSCGACTVLLNGKPVFSCLVLASSAKGKDIQTIEGLAQNGKLHPLQKAFHEKGAVQCGYCTPGMIMSGKALLDSNPHPTKDEAKDAISGNMCRCTGYAKIVEAILSVKEIQR
ncbi:MAG: (2Fe-2S)-binding protein [Pseudomonadota bacterium]